MSSAFSDADIKVIIQLNGVRRTPAADGYRPAHRVKSDYLATGIHHYTTSDFLSPCGSCEGTITFLTPEVYPHCLQVGQVLDIQEGERNIGSAKIIEINNKKLEVPAE